MTDCDALRVLVVDDHPGVRAGIVGLIDAEYPNMRVVGAAASADEALEQTRARRPDVVVLDVNLGGDDGLALIPLLHRAAPCEVVVLSSLLDPEVAAYAQRMGAHACLQKIAPASELLEHILAAGCPAAVQPPHLAALRAQTKESAMPHEAFPALATIGAFVREEGGVTAIEYGLLAALIVVVSIAGFTLTGTSLNALYTTWTDAVLAVL